MKRQAKRAKTPETKAAKVARAKKRRKILAEKVQARTNGIERDLEQALSRLTVTKAALRIASKELAELRQFKAEHTPPPVVETPATESPANAV